MPWLSIIVAIISFLLEKKRNGGNTARAAAVGAIAGLGTYYVSHETEWGRANLGDLDGVVATPTVVPGGTDVPKNADGTPGTKNEDGSYTVLDTSGTPVKVYPSNSAGTIGGTQGITGGGVTVPGAAAGSNGATSGLWDTLQSWGPTGTAAVVGTATVASSSSLQKYLPLIIIGGGLLLLSR